MSIRRLIKQTAEANISIMSTTYKILSNILLTRLNPYAEEITEDHQCGFRRNRSTTESCILLSSNTSEKWACTEAVHQLFVDFPDSLPFSWEGGAV